MGLMRKTAMEVTSKRGTLIIPVMRIPKNFQNSKFLKSPSSFVNEAGYVNVPGLGKKKRKIKKTTDTLADFHFIANIKEGKQKLNMHGGAIDILDYTSLFRKYKESQS